MNSINNLQKHLVDCSLLDLHVGVFFSVVNVICVTIYLGSLALNLRYIYINK